MFIKIKNLNVYFKTAIISSFLGVILTVILSFLFFIGWQEIPLGFLIGLFVGVIFQFLMGIINDKLKKEGKKSSSSVILITILRLIFIGGVLFLIGYLYYGLNIRIFNIFAATVGYLLVTIVLIVLSLINKGSEDE